MPEAPVNPLIIAKGKELFLLIWECLSGRSEWTSVNRFIQDDISDADRVLVLYAAFYAVNTKCEHCHAAIGIKIKSSAKECLVFFSLRRF